MAKTNPIFGTDLTGPPSEALARVRSKIANLRGQLSDIANEFGWKENIDCIEGLLTCGISTLYYVVEEMKTAERRRADEDAANSIQANTRRIAEQARVEANT